MCSGSLVCRCVAVVHPVVARRWCSGHLQGVAVNWSSLLGGRTLLCRGEVASMACCELCALPLSLAAHAAADVAYWWLCAGAYHASFQGVSPVAGSCEEPLVSFQVRLVFAGHLCPCFPALRWGGGWGGELQLLCRQHHSSRLHPVPPCSSGVPRRPSGASPEPR